MRPHHSGGGGAVAGGEGGGDRSERAQLSITDVVITVCVCGRAFFRDHTLALVRLPDEEICYL